MQLFSALVQIAGHFHDLPGRGTSGKKRDCSANSWTVGMSDLGSIPDALRDATKLLVYS